MNPVTSGASSRPGSSLDLPSPGTSCQEYQLCSTITAMGIVAITKPKRRQTRHGASGPGPESVPVPVASPDEPSPTPSAAPEPSACNRLATDRAIYLQETLCCWKLLFSASNGVLLMVLQSLVLVTAFIFVPVCRDRWFEQREAAAHTGLGAQREQLRRLLTLSHPNGIPPIHTKRICAYTHQGYCTPKIGIMYAKGKVNGQ